MNTVSNNKGLCQQPCICGYGCLQNTCPPEKSRFGAISAPASTERILGESWCLFSERLLSLQTLVPILPVHMAVYTTRCGKVGALVPALRRAVDTKPSPIHHRRFLSYNFRRAEGAPIRYNAMRCDVIPRATHRTT